MTDTNTTPAGTTQTSQDAPWWTQVVESDPLLDDNSVSDPLRTAHYEYLDEMMTQYTTRLKEDLLERMKAIYVHHNGVAPLTHDRYFGLGQTTLRDFHLLLVKDLSLRASQVYKEHMHKMMIAKYRIGEEIVHMPRRKRYIVVARPDQLALTKEGDFQYALQDPETGLSESVAASEVESTSYMRCIDGMIPDYPQPDAEDYPDMHDPAHRWLTEHGRPAPWVPEVCYYKG